MALIRVRYRGLSDVRIISQKDLKDRGIEVNKDMVWERSNNWALTLDGLSKPMEDLLRGEGHFRIEEVKDDGSEGVIVDVEHRVDDTGSTVVDATTGAKSTKKS